MPPSGFPDPWEFLCLHQGPPLCCPQPDPGGGRQGICPEAAREAGQTAVQDCAHPAPHPRQMCVPAEGESFMCALGGCRSGQAAKTPGAGCCEWEVNSVQISLRTHHAWQPERQTCNCFLGTWDRSASQRTLGPPGFQPLSEPWGFVPRAR